MFNYNKFVDHINVFICVGYILSKVPISNVKNFPMGWLQLGYECAKTVKAVKAPESLINVSGKK